MAKVNKKILLLPIESLKLPEPVYNILKHYRIETIGELAEHTVKDLMRFKNMGLNNLEHIRVALDNFNVKLAGQ